MPKRSKVDGLPASVKEWLDQALIGGNFADYKLLAAELKAKGFDISKSSLHRHGSLLEKRLAQLKASTEQAKALVQASPDDEDSMNQALTRLMQDKLFGVLMELDIDPDMVDVNKLGRAIADLSRASVSSKKWANEVRAKAAAAAKAAADIATKGGLSKASVDEIRKQILGVAT